MLTNPTFHVGGAAIIQRGFEPTETLRLPSTQATGFFGVTAIYLFRSQRPDFDRTDLSRVRTCSVGSAPIPTSLLLLYRRRGGDDFEE